MSCARTFFIIESVGYAAGVGHTSPNGFGEILAVAVNGHTAFKIFLSVLENVFAYLSQVDVEISAVVSGGVLLVHEGVHHPELDVLDVLRFKVGILHSAHQSAPSCFRTGEAAV